MIVIRIPDLLGSETLAIGTPTSPKYPSVVSARMGTPCGVEGSAAGSPGMVSRQRLAAARLPVRLPDGLAGRAAGRFELDHRHRQDGVSDDLDDVQAGKRPEPLGDHEAIVGAVRVDLQLDQLVIGQRLLDLLDHGGRQAALADVNDRRQRVPVGAQRSPQFARRHQGTLLWAGGAGG